MRRPVSHLDIPDAAGLSKPPESIPQHNPGDSPEHHRSAVRRLRPEVGKVDMKLENQVIAVSDVDRSKQFYEQLSWRLDDDVAPMDGLRIVQFTPPGSGTSVTFGEGLATSAPGSAQAVLVVSDIEAAYADLVARGIDAADVWHGPPFPVEARQPGVDPQRTSYGSFPPSTIPTAMCGSSRRSRPGMPAGWTALAWRLRPRRSWRVRFGVPRPPTASAEARRPSAQGRGGGARPQRGVAQLVRLVHEGGAGRDGPA